MIRFKREMNVCSFSLPSKKALYYLHKNSKCEHVKTFLLSFFSTTFLRGQAAFVDPVTRKEQEEKRRVHLEYQVL